MPVEGTYDEVNRLCLELTDELEGWAFLNVNLRPFYAEGSKTIAFEIAQQLGWRTPDVVVAPLASGSLFTKLARGFRELSAVGLVQTAPIRYVGGQPEGCAPIASAFGSGADLVHPVERPETIVRSLAIGSPADGAYAVRLARESGGAILPVPDAATVDAIRLLAETEGILTETAGGVTLAALRRAIAEGRVQPDDEVVLVITGNGIKTLDVLDWRLAVSVGEHRPTLRRSRPAGRLWRRPKTRRAGLASAQVACLRMLRSVRSISESGYAHFALDGWSGLPSHFGLDVTTAIFSSASRRGPAWRHGPRRLRSG